MSEEITIKIKISAKMAGEENAKTVNHEIDIKINQNATINDLVEKIKEQKELVKGQKYLYLESDVALTGNNLSNTLEHHKIGNNSVLTANLLPFGENSKPENPQCWVNISGEINIKIRRLSGQQKEISLNKNTKCSELIKLIKNDKDITGDNKHFLLMFGGQVITTTENVEKTLGQLKVSDQSTINIAFNDSNSLELLGNKWIKIPEQQEQNKEADNNTNNNKIKEGTYIETEQLGPKISEITDLNSANNTETKNIEIQNNNDNQYCKCDKFGCFFKRQISLRSRLWFSFKLILYFTFVGKCPVSYKNVEFSSRIKNKIIRFFIAVLLIASIPMLGLGIAFLCLSMLIKLAITMTAVGAFLSIIFVCSCFVINAKLNSEISGKQFITLNKFPVSYNSRNSIIPIPTTEDIPQKNSKADISN